MLIELGNLKNREKRVQRKMNNLRTCETVASSVTYENCNSIEINEGKYLKK